MLSLTAEEREKLTTKTVKPIAYYNALYYMSLLEYLNEGEASYFAVEHGIKLGDVLVDYGRCDVI